ncbi:MAG: diaminopimelate decarboxylase, partial [Spirochaetia bacterium]|nr:diaminopimelate decarboxylase [Spirochaetia bacterium]
MINKDEIKKIVETYGNPVYVFEEEKFLQNYDNLQSAFKNIYPNYGIGYSYKTNYTPYICKIVKELGGFAEIVSDMEYHLAKQLGYENSQIIYNGPWKGEKLEDHILANGMVNIDGIDEAQRIVLLAKQNPERLISIGLRINTDIG